MISINPYQNYHNRYATAFGSKFIIKKAGLINRAKLNLLTSKAIINEPANNFQASKLIIILNSIVSALDPKIDMYCLLNKNKKIIGGFSAEKALMKYHITGMFIQKNLRNHKDSLEGLKLIYEKIRECAQHAKKPLISCWASINNKSAVRLYKKMGFEESYETRYNQVFMMAVTSNFGKKLSANIKKLGLKKTVE